MGLYQSITNTLLLLAWYFYQVTFFVKKKKEKTQLQISVLPLDLFFVVNRYALINTTTTSYKYY